MHTYASIYLHVVFATWSRKRFLNDTLRPRMHRLLASALREVNVEDVVVGGFEDHVHFLGRFGPTMIAADIVGRVKNATSRLISHEVPAFRWQRGYSAFSVSRDRVASVARYIERQEQHHRHVDFNEELRSILGAHGIAFEDAHLI
jgi:putative transposase